ncbi:flagellar hook-basal body complex protein [Sphingomonas sp. BT-65]|uniref:flagellar hook-basal body complex protein n=1 Tax=Sphingomonas sp. BT-65 TaxID=2989821 RepID=UPI00223699DF|nr:flagellar hook-basal body complex protein [Sphingomonas sp. BT-65]MCW4463801.1 flagellar hook-basal body complex protein [Sphingomonas sp. BT-65]
MFGAIYIGLSGLNAYSNGLKQVSNNVTNLNTSGFKGQTVTFENYAGRSDLGGLSFSLEGQGTGGGVETGKSQLDLRQGELRQTDRDLDLTVDGTGFLVLFDGSEMLYTTTGSFSIDKEGYIVLTGTNYRLATLDASNQPVALSIDLSRTNPPKATTTVKFTNNLSADAKDPHSVSNIKVYDSTGKMHTWTATFTKKPNPDTTTNPGATFWDVDVTDSTGKTIVEDKTLKFVNGIIDQTTARFDATNSDVSLTVKLDFAAGVTSQSGGAISQLSTSSVDGYGLGSLTSVGINADGEVELGYSNEQKTQLGAVAIADFREPQVLESRGASLFGVIGNGQPEIMTSADPRVGQVVGRRLEASNVDLSRQFGDLILIQRGFQASSQIVSVSNDMIQQLFGIRGQG